MSQYAGIQWVVQRNLTGKNEFDALQQACEAEGIPFTALHIIPFSTSLPAFDRSRKTIMYGSTTFNLLALQDVELRSGVFFDEQSFSIENYMAKWGRHLLNYDATVTTFRKLMEGQQYAPDKLLFIRPDDDSKAFAGQVKSFGEVADWYAQLCAVENISITPDTPVVVGEPYNIACEWRLWVVNKKVVAASQYRTYFNLNKQQGAPEHVIAFAEERCREYTPHDVFVMDICLCGDALYIVECGCLNGAGFYKADIAAIVKNVSDYFIAAQAVTS
jgi:hypothetical protein